jgi:hypothetical protein
VFFYDGYTQVGCKRPDTSPCTPSAALNLWCLNLLAHHCCSQEARLTDGAGQKPAYNLRTLCRALDYARMAAPLYGLQRALYDGFSMAFMTQV